MGAEPRIARAAASLLAAGLASGGAARGAPEDEAPLLAIRVARAETVSEGPVEGATILVRGTKIAAVGANVPVSKKAKVLDARDLVAVPGWVVPVTRLTLSSDRGRGTFAHLRVVDELYPFDETWREALRRGVTTLGLAPAGGGIAGRGAVVRPKGAKPSEMALVEDAFLALDVQVNAAAKKLLRDALGSAKREIEKADKARQEWEEKRKKAESPPATQPAPQPATRQAAETRPATRPATQPAEEFKPPAIDPKVEPLVRLLRKEIRALVSLRSPAEWLHFRDAVSEHPFDYAVVADGSLFLVADRIAKEKVAVVLSPELAFEPHTRNRVNPAAVFAKAGVDVAFAPAPDSIGGFEAYPFRVAEVVKAGLDRATALRAMTLVPARVLGIEGRVGSIAEGRDANLLFFDGDPFDPRARLRKVMLEGAFVFEE